MGSRWGHCLGRAWEREEVVGTIVLRIWKDSERGGRGQSRREAHSWRKWKVAEPSDLGAQRAFPGARSPWWRASVFTWLGPRERELESRRPEIKGAGKLVVSISACGWGLKSNSNWLPWDSVHKGN